ncbi:MAG TPA: MGMT family protein [Polyangiaceae bacterium]|nr:MGMT family protein [Polyangiaceae bacterium]
MDDLSARVLELVATIPPGRVLSYGDVAARVGAPTPREVGEVLQHQGHDVPWWRVLRVDGTCAPHLRDRQLALLAAEGAPLSPTGDAVDMPLARWAEGGPAPGDGHQLSLFG